MSDPGDHPHPAGHIPVLVDRCVELLTPALTRNTPDGSGAVLVDATLGAAGHAAIYTDHAHAIHILRKVILRVGALTNYLVLKLH